MTLPPDRGHLATEQRNAASMTLDEIDAASMVVLMAEDHREVVDAILNARNEIAGFVESLVKRMREGGRLIYIGAGTSGRLGVLDASECPPTFQADTNQVVGIIAGGDTSLRKSSESKEDIPDGAKEELENLNVNTLDTVLGIAAGGTTPYVLGGIELAGKMGANTGLLTCTKQHTTVECDHLILLDTGAELLTGSTRLKAGSATKLALNIITTTAFVQLGKTYGNLMVDLRATNDKLTDRAIRIMIEISPELTREDAAGLLNTARGELKAAIVMEKRGVNLDTAKQLLDEHNGILRAVIGFNH